MLNLYNEDTVSGYSYTLSREYHVVRNRYLQLLFTSEDRLCINLREQELVMRFTNDLYSWLRHSWKLMAKRPTRDPKNRYSR